MGIPKKSYIRIEFKKDFELPEEFHNVEALLKALIDFYRKQNPEGSQNPDFTIYDFEAFNYEVQFEMYSTRIPNLDFQVALLHEYLDAKYLEQVVEVNEDDWTQS